MISFEERRERRRSQNRAWYRRNATREKARSQRYHDRNRQQVHTAWANRSEAERERRRIYMRSYRLLHPAVLAAVRASVKAWRIRYPEKYAELRANGRARKRGAVGSHTWQEWRDLVQLHANCCFYCGERKPLTRDHKIPISRGGTDEIGNILPACALCNSRKGRRTTIEYLEKVA